MVSFGQWGLFPTGLSCQDDSVLPGDTLGVSVWIVWGPWVFRAFPALVRAPPEKGPGKSRAEREVFTKMSRLYHQHMSLLWAWAAAGRVDIWSFLDSARSKAVGNAFHWTSICARTCESIPETGPMCAPSMAVIRSLLSQLT